MRLSAGKFDVVVVPNIPLMVKKVRRLWKYNFITLFASSPNPQLECKLMN